MDGNYYSLILYFLLALASLSVFIYFYMTSAYNFWKDRGVPYIKPSFPFGTLGDVVMGRKSHIDLMVEQYKQFEKERYYGIFNFHKPVLMIKDPSLIERVMVTDFTSFCDKVDVDFNKKDYLAFNLGNLRGDLWRQLRQKLNGAFSVTKLKSMVELMSNCGDTFIENICKCDSKLEPAMADCLAYKYSSRIIANCVFGVECDGIGLQTFILHVKKLLPIFEVRVVHMLNLCYMFLPEYAWLLHFLPPVATVVNYFKDQTADTVKARKESGRRRNDFLQVMLDLKEEEENNTELNDGETATKKIQSIHNLSLEAKELILSNHWVTAQLFIFMSLGMESSAIAITFLLWELASRQEIQQKVQQEIDEVMEKFGELNYDALQQLTFLDLVIQESLRIRPGFPNISRVCTSPYKIPGSDLVLEKGTVIMVPIPAVQMDPQNYPDPEHFNPERFINNHYKPSATYMPFGIGPRMCVAFKLVVLKLKLAIAKMMLKYTVTLSKETELPLRYAPMFMPKLLKGLYVEFESRKTQFGQNK